MWRNNVVFENSFRQSNNIVMVIQNFTGEIDLCSAHPPYHNLQIKETIYILWDKPLEGRIKLNSGGACKGGGENSGCRGLFHNSNGKWLKGDIRKIRVCDTLHAKLGHVSWFGYGLVRTHYAIHYGK